MTPKRIGFIGFDGVVALDLIGPIEAFDSVKIHEGKGQSCRGYDVVIIGLTRRPFVAESGVVFQLQKPYIAKMVSAFVKKRALRTRRIVSICTGIYGLAATGLLAGRQVTTHWRFAPDVARRFPDLRISDNAIFVKDGPFYTSAGVTAGIDLSLFLIEEDYGSRAALAVARELVVYLKRSGGQEQYSEPLQFQTQTVSRLSELTTWMLSHLNEDLSVEVLAAKACLCPRHFSRRFKIEFGATPADFVERLRLDEARRRLSLAAH